MKNEKAMILLFLIIAFIIGCEEEQNPKENLKTNVEVTKVMRMSIDDMIAYSGSISESKIFPLSFSVAGTITNICVAEGEFVKSGQLIAELNDITIKNAYEVSLATLKQAEDAYNRFKPMFENGNLPEIKFIEIKTGLQQAKSSEAISKKNLEDCKLYAPIAGYVGSRTVEEGQNALPGMTAFSIVDIDKIFADIQVSESEISEIKKGQNAVVSIGALKGANYKGVIHEVGVMSDPISHTYKVRISVENIMRQIKPGMICEVRIRTEEDELKIVLPNNSVQVDEQGRRFVFNIDEEKLIATRKYVSTGKYLNKGIEVLSGLSEGDYVVIAGQQKLVDSTLVNIINN